MANFKSNLNNLKINAQKIKREVLALYLAYKRPDVPWRAKIVAAIVVGYALSPIDFIPDFIPVLGYLDDLILLPLGISIAIKMIPENIMEECRIEARETFVTGKPRNRIAAVIIILVWLAIAGAILIKILKD